MDDNYMIGVEKAIALVNAHTKVGVKKNIPLLEALNLYVAEDIFSPIDMPPFHQSAMDGYAILFDDKHQNNFILVDEIKAGDNKKSTLNIGEAARIFTGAPIPSNANAVIMQEHTVIRDEVLNVKDSLTHQKNIRLKGEQIKKQALALKKGAQLNPAAIGFLATLGITKVTVYQKPSISIVVTGNELATAGTPLKFGQIYESNAIMLQTALLKIGLDKITITKVKDEYEATKQSLKNAIEKSDFVLISGGISVGDYDFVGKALLELNTQKIFYKIKQKPGKPLFYGKNKETNIFALPGNPASALTCFYIYITIALQKFIGNPCPKQQTIRLALAHEYLKKGTRGEFLKAKATNQKVEILDSQSSAMLNTFATANALVYVEEQAKVIHKNELVSVYMIN